MEDNILQEKKWEEERRAAVEEYVRFLAEKGYVCERHDTCDGCCAFSPRSKVEILGGDDDIPFDEIIRKNYFIGECVCGFSQKWIDFGVAVPLEKCPKPMTKIDFFRCIKMID